MEQTRREIQTETRRAIQEIRSEVADLTVLATEKVTRKSLDRGRPEAPRRRGAVGAGLRRPRRRRPAQRRRELTRVEEIASVYARSLFEVAQEQDKLDEVREQLGEFADVARRGPRAAGVLLLALLLHAGEEGRAGEGGHRRRGDAHQLPRPADRQAPHADPLPHAPRSSTSSGARRTAAAGAGRPRPSSSTRRSSSASATASRSRPAARSSCPPTSSRTSSAGSSCGSATRCSTPRSATASKSLRKQVARA